MSFVETLRNIKLKEQRVLVVGMGISGIETARFLLDVGIVPVCTERQDLAQFRERSKFVSEADLLADRGAVLAFGIDGEKVGPYLDNVGLAVLSPGVGLETAIVGAIERQGVPIISELELGVELHPGKTVVVTGSIGKSTTVSLLHDILVRSGIPAILCGNVGTPVIASAHLREVFSESAPIDLPVLVVEASSYQLESCTVLKPSVCVFLNLVENHLERHGTMARYGAAKAKAFARQDSEDLVICSYDDKRVFELGRAARAELALFGVARLSEMLAFTKCGAAVAGSQLDLQVEGNVLTFDVSNALLLGQHNRINMAAAALAAIRLGARVDSIAESLIKFPPLEHRLERIEGTVSPVVINDSKSTTVASAVAALSTVIEAFSSSKIILMIGGLSKAGSWAPLFERLQLAGSRVERVVCFGKDGPLLATHGANYGITCVVAATMSDGFRLAISGPNDGRVVLLSPGCASFDEFTDFEHRGRVFKELVRG